MNEDVSFPYNYTSRDDDDTYMEFFLFILKKNHVRVRLQNPPKSLLKFLIVIKSEVLIIFMKCFTTVSLKSLHTICSNILAVWLYRRSRKKSVERVKKFFKWLSRKISRERKKISHAHRGLWLTTTTSRYLIMVCLFGYMLCEL